MKRRHFLQAAGAAAAGATLRTTRSLAQEAENISTDRSVVLEKPRRTPVVADVDVLVVGAGPAGVGAALAAARGGARVLLVERHGMLGGIWTAGLLNPFYDFKRKGWLVAEMIQRLEAAGAWADWKGSGSFDTEVMKITLESLMAEAGVEFWYYSFAVDTIVENGSVRGAIIESKSGREAVLAKVVIDASGDGDVAAHAGAPFQLGRLEDGMCQPMTLMFEVTGVKNYTQNSGEELYDQMVRVIAEHDLPVKLPFARVGYAPWVIHFPRPDTADVEATHIYGVSGLDTRQLTHAAVEGRRQAHDLVRVMRHIAGLEHVQLTQTAPGIGVRECRRIEGQYTLTLDDLRAGRDWPDAITFCGFNVDIHNVQNPDDSAASHGTSCAYGIPYRCLLPRTLDNLLVAGRCISGTHEAHASYRVTGTCMAMGQAAGLAAAIAVTEGKPPADLDGTAVRAELVRRGAGMLPDYLS